MFGIKTYEADGFESSWKSEKNFQNESAQTINSETKEVFTNTAESINIQTQTEQFDQIDPIKPNVDMDRLAKWLKSIYPEVLKELDDDSVTRAMALTEQNDNDNDEELITSVNQMQNLTISTASGDENFYVSSLSWNCTGNTLAVSCCYPHESWCHHQGIVNLFTYDRDDKFPEVPNRKLLCTSCVTIVAFHPNHPAVICAGTVSGNVLLWNNQDDETDNLIASFNIHDDYVTSLVWTSTKKSSKFDLVSSGLDSYLIIWDFNVDESILKIKQKYKTEKYSQKKCERGIIHFDFSPFISNLFVVGLEGGCIVKCSLIGAQPLPNNGDVVLDPSISSFEKHDGEITSISFSPHRKDLFLSCGTDKEIRIFHTEQANPVQIIFMDLTLNSVSWIVNEEQLLIGCATNGAIRLYSLRNGQLITSTEFVNDEQPLMKLAVNQKRNNLAAFGDNSGHVQIWSIPWNNIAKKECYNNTNVFEN